MSILLNNLRNICIKTPLSHLVKRHIIYKPKTNLVIKNYTTTNNNPLDVGKVVKDVILYKLDKGKFFKVINVVGIVQFGIWSYLSYVMYKYLKDIPVDQVKEWDIWWTKINLGDQKFRTGFVIVAFLVGWSSLMITWMLTLRSVKYLILRKGGQDLTIVTYTPVGTNRLVTLNLSNVSAKDHRNTAKSVLPLKVKGHALHYILDMKGEFRNGELFDRTVGLQRNLKNVK